MARMHSRKKGKSGSTKPAKRTVPSWLGYKAKEIELLIAKLAKDGKSGSAIGMYLRDVYGIPDVKLVTSKRMQQILQEKNLSKQLPEDLVALIKKSVKIRKHLKTMRKDMPAKRGLQLTESKIGRLAKYYKRTGVLKPDWKYDPETASFYIE